MEIIAAPASITECPWLDFSSTSIPSINRAACCRNSVRPPELGWEWSSKEQNNSSCCSYVFSYNLLCRESMCRLVCMRVMGSGGGGGFVMAGSISPGIQGFERVGDIPRKEDLKKKNKNKKPV